VAAHGRIRAAPRSHAKRRANRAGLYQLIDNANCLLDKAEDYWGVDQDIKSLAESIGIYINRNGCWHSPEFLIGESCQDLDCLLPFSVSLQDEFHFRSQITTVLPGDCGG
jgi:hypothetical protein